MKKTTEKIDDNSGSTALTLSTKSVDAVRKRKRDDVEHELVTVSSSPIQQIVEQQDTNQQTVPTLRTRMSPSMIMRFINSNLSEQQIEDIKTMGFGGILKLKTDTVPGILAHWLVSNFNTCNSSLMNGELRIMDEDIHLSTGIPMGPLEVDIASSGDKSEEFRVFKSIWLKQFPGTLTKVDTSDVLKLIISQREGGEAFKRNFIVFIVSSFLMGVSGTTATLRVLKCLRDVSLIPKMNWSGFTRKQLIKSVDGWRKNTNGGAYFGGPIMVLVFIYLDRVSFKCHTVPRVFPTLASWSKEIIATRILDEKHDGFGKGAVEPRIIIPVDHDHEPVDNLVKGSSTIKKLAETANSLAVAYHNFSKALIEAKMERPDCQLVAKMASMAELLCHSSQQSMEEHHDVNRKGSDINEGVDISEETMESKARREFASHGNFESEDELFDALLKLEIALGKRPAKEEINAAPSPEPLKAKTKASSSRQSPRFRAPPPKSPRFRQSPRFRPPPPSTSLSSIPPAQSTSQSCKPPPHPTSFRPTTNIKLTRKEAASPPLISVPNNEAVSPPPISVPNKEVASLPTNVPNKEVASSPMLLHSQHFPSRRKSPRFSQTTPPPISPPSFKLIHSSQENDSEPIEVVAILDTPPPPSSSQSARISPDFSAPRELKRLRFASEVFKSPFLERNIRVVGEFNQAEKDLLELAFGESFLDSEILFKSDHYMLSRGDLKKVISGEKVPDSVIYTWCDILNLNEISKSREAPLRFYMPITKKEVIDDHFVAASLIFVPYPSPKPLVFCFNFLTSKLEVMHAMKLNSLKYKHRIKSTKDSLCNYLEQQMPSIRSVHWQKLDEYVPKSNLGDNIDSGIYLMRIMETYKGTRKGYTMALLDDHQVKIYSARVCYKILTSYENQLKDKILEAAHSLASGLRFHDIQSVHPISSSLALASYADEELVRKVCNSRRDAEYLNEVLIDTQWIQVTRKALRSLQQRKEVMDLVIDAFGVMCTFRRSQFLYLPSTVKYTERHKKNIIYSPFLMMNYIPKVGGRIHKVFFPICHGNHWFACASDLKNKKNYVLDSCMPSGEKLKARNLLVKNIITSVEKAFDKRNGYDILTGISDFDLENVDVPQQTNIHDCGLYVMKFLEATMVDPKLWKDKSGFKDLAFYRQDIMLELLKWEENKQKLFS